MNYGQSNNGQQQQGASPMMMQGGSSAMQAMIDPPLSAELERLRRELVNLGMADIVAGCILVLASLWTWTWWLGCGFIVSGLFIRTHMSRAWNLMNNSCVVQPQSLPSGILVLHIIGVIGCFLAIIIQISFIAAWSNAGLTSNFYFYASIFGLIVTLGSLVVAGMVLFKVNQFKPVFLREHISYMQSSSQQQLGTNLMMMTGGGNNGMLGSPMPQQQRQQQQYQSPMMQQQPVMGQPMMAQQPNNNVYGQPQQQQQGGKTAAW